MMDRLLVCTLNFTIVTMTAALAGGSLAFGYWGLIDLLNSHPARGGIFMLAGLALVLATCTLARYRNELADRY